MKIDNAQILVAADYLVENWFEDEANILRCIVKGRGYEIKMPNHLPGLLTESEITAILLLMCQSWRKKLECIQVNKGDSLNLTYTITIE